MISNRRASIASALLTACLACPHANAQFIPPAPTPIEPSNNAVLLPPQTFDAPVKGPNTTREHRGVWTIYAGVYFLQPVFSTNPAFVVNGGNTTRQVNFDYHLEVAPDVWLAYVSERGWGVRGRWFQFNHGETAGYAVIPGETVMGMSALGFGKIPVSGSVVASSQLGVGLADLQATCTFDGPRWSHLIGLGVRYTHMNQDYHASLSSNNAPVDLTSHHDFNGAGPCFSFETKRRIKETSFAIYGQLNAAILFGTSNEYYAAASNGVVQQFVRNNTDVLPVGEMELGGEYCKNLGKAGVFVQAGFAGQIWWGGGNASNLDGLAGSSAANSNFGFVGLALRAGVRY